MIFLGKKLKVKHLFSFFPPLIVKIMLHRENTRKLTSTKYRRRKTGGRDREEDEEEIRKGHEIKRRNPSESNYADRG